MNYRMVAYLLGIILAIEAALLLIPTGCALLYGETVLPFLYTIAILCAVSLVLLLFRPENRRIYAKEGFICVAAAWILMSAFGALPFVFSGAIPSYIDAFFETASGFSTTGASILSAVEGLPYGILFWRSFTHWIGGMGVLVFVIAILPGKDGGAIFLMRAEVPGPTKGKLVPKLRQTALILYGIYCAFTVLETVLLLFTGLPLYDALVNTFATVGTGGFSVKNLSIAAYANPAAEWVIAAFMFLCGINFNLYYFFLIKRFGDIFRNEEFRVYLSIVIGATALIAFNTASLFSNTWDCIRTAFFQVTTVASTSGFATADFNLWPALSKTVLCLLMMTGACAGSTAGGLKLSRICILFKSMKKEIKHALHPHSVNAISMDGESIGGETTRGALHYVALYLFLFMGSVLLLSLDWQVDYGTFSSLETNMSAVLACFNNIGPGFGAVGPMGNYAGYGVLSKIVLSLDMLFGRLELLPMLILFAPSTWKRH